MVKPFWQSTSFWTMIGAMVACVLGTIFLDIPTPEKISLIVAGIVGALGVGFKRGFVEGKALLANAAVEAAKEAAKKDPS
jgi:hypothetical protein